MGLGDVLGGGSSSSTTTIEPWKPQQPYLRDVFKAAQNQFNAGVPDVSGVQAIGMNTAQQLQDLQGQGIGADTINAGGQAVQTLANPGLLDPASNPALQAYMDQAARITARNFSQGLGTNVSAPAGIYNQVGSSRHGVAQGLAAQGLADALGLQQAQLAATGYGQGLQALGQGASLAPGVAAGQQQNALFDPQLGQMAYNTQLNAQTLPYDLQRQSLLDYSRAVGGNFGSVQSGPATQSGGLVGALGGGLAGAGIAGALPAGMEQYNPWIVGAGALLGALG
jgi:hypothetical protein